MTAAQQSDLETALLVWAAARCHNIELNIQAIALMEQIEKRDPDVVTRWIGHAMPDPRQNMIRHPREVLTRVLNLIENAPLPIQFARLSQAGVIDSLARGEELDTRVIALILAQPDISKRICLLTQTETDITSLGTEAQNAIIPTFESANPNQQLQMILWGCPRKRNHEQEVTQGLSGRTIEARDKLYTAFCVAATQIPAVIVHDESTRRTLSNLARNAPRAAA